MLKTRFHDDIDTMVIRYSTDGKLFNLRRLQARTKVKEERVRDFLFVDDYALNASSEDEMQRNMAKCSSACDVFALTISTKKTEVMFLPAPHTNYSYPTITVKGQKLQTVEKYLGSILSRNVLIADQAGARIAKAKIAFGRLRKNMWERQGLNLQSKQS